MNAPGHAAAPGGGTEGGRLADQPGGLRTTIRGCPDCTRTRRPDLTLEHDPGCPVGADLDATSARDRAWFAAHPWATEYRRPLTYSERVTLAEAQGLPLGARIVGRVTVRNVAPGIRVRAFSGLETLTLDPAGGAA